MRKEIQFSNLPSINWSQISTATFQDQLQLILCHQYISNLGAKNNTLEAKRSLLDFIFCEKAALNWFEVTQGPEQHSPSRVWSLQRAKKCARRALETGYGAGAQAHANRFLALNHAARPFSQGCTMINTQHTTRNLTVTEKTYDFTLVIARAENNIGLYANSSQMY